MVILVSHSSAWCDSLEGTWQGRLDLGLAKFRVALAIQMDSLGKTRVFFNNIDDGIYDEPAVIIDDSDPLLKIRLEKSQILILGFKSNKQYLSGTYLQANGNFEKEGLASPLTLRAGKDYLFPRLDSRGNPQTGYTYQAPVAVGDGWKIGDLSAKGALLFESGIKKILDGTFPHIHGVAVAQGGRLLADETFYGYSSPDPHPVQSITKSVFSLLFGIARDKGLIQTNQKLFDYFPEYLSQKRWDPRKNQITLEHLLTMSSGFDCSDWNDAQDCSWGMVKSNDWQDFALSKPLVQNPGTQFAYCGTCLLPLSVILDKVSGLSVPEFAQKYLFDPLDIHSAQWVNAPSAGTTVVPVSFGLSMTPRDLAKIGLLVLQKGLWSGKQIVSEDWIKQSTSLQVPRNQTNKKYDYGYLWWETEMPAGDKMVKIIMGWGAGGNYLFIVPEKDLVCVVTAGNYGDSKTAQVSLKLFQDYVLPAFSMP